MSIHSQQIRDYTGRSLLITMLINCAILSFFFVVGYSFQQSGIANNDLWKASQGLRLASLDASRNFWWILCNNLEVGIKLSVFSTLPFYGAIAANGKLGLSLGLLAKSIAANSGLPTITKILLVIPHGIPEYLGLLLMIASVGAFYTAFIYQMLGRCVKWWRVFIYSLGSMLVGITLVIVAAAIESYITPKIAEKSLWL